MPKLLSFDGNAKTVKYRPGKSGKETVYTTPRTLINLLRREFPFTLDVCALPENAQASKFFSPSDNGLLQSWQGETCWMNPPFGWGIDAWIRKAYEESQLGCTVVAILPGRTSSPWFHNYVMRAAEVRFLVSKTYFTETVTGKKYIPFLGMLIVVFKAGKHRTKFSSMGQLL